MKHVLFRNLIVRLLRGIAYCSTVLQWLWLLLLLLPPLLESGKIDSFSAPQASESIVRANSIEPSPLVWLFVCVVTAVVLLVTLLIFVRLPRTILRTGEKIVHQTSEAVIPALTHHKVLPAKRRREISRRLTLAIQLAVSLLALLITLLTPPYEQITKEIIITIGLGLTAISLTAFIIAWLVEPRTKVRVTSRTRSPVSRG